MKELENVMSQLEKETKKKERGIKLNYVEAKGYLSAQLHELAREGKTVAELMEIGTKLLKEEDVMDGIADMVGNVQIEATFNDGTKLVSIHNPIRK